MPEEINQDTQLDRRAMEFTLDDFLSQGDAIETEEPQKGVAAPEPEVEVEDPAPEPEAPTEPEPEPEPEEEEEQLPQQPTVYAELLKDYISSGDWEDAIVEMDGEEVKLSELEALDKETFLQIKSTQKEIAQEKLKEKYIDVEGLDETDLQLINLKKSGGDWTYLLQHEAENIHPLEGLDLDDENVQLWLLSEQYKSQGMEPEAIKVQLTTDKKNFKLDEKSKRVVDNINGSFSKMVEAENQRKQQEIAAIQEQRKELAKGVKESYKSFELKDTAIKRFVDTATKDVGGGRTKLDALVEDYKKDPEKLAKLAFFLEDEKGFLEYNGAKQKNKNNLRTIRLIQDTAKKDKDISKAATEEEKTDPWSKLTFKKPVNQ